MGERPIMTPNVASARHRACRQGTPPDVFPNTNTDAARFLPRAPEPAAIGRGGAGRGQ
jgi:hypothetical protein